MTVSRGEPFLGQAIRNTSSAIVPSVIREIEIWRVAVLMVNRYADEAEANSFGRAEELRSKCESRRSAPQLAAEGDYAGRLSGVELLSRLSSFRTRRDY